MLQLKCEIIKLRNVKFNVNLVTILFYEKVTLPIYFTDRTTTTTIIIIVKDKF